MEEHTRSRLVRSLKLALMFQLLWGVALFFAPLFRYEVPVVFVVCMMFALWLPALVELLTRTVVPRALQVHYHFFISASSIAGTAFGMYAIVPHWDSWVHLYSGIVLGWMGLFILRKVEQRGKTDLPRWFCLCVAVMTALAFGAIWEVCEFMSDRFIGTTTQFGLEDTIVDMAAAGVGAVFVAIAAAWLHTPRTLIPEVLKRRG